MKERTKIKLVGIEGAIYEAEYEIHDFYDRGDDILKIEFRIFLKGDKYDEWFDFKLAPISNDTLKVTGMFIGKESHRGKGIPDAMILEARRIFQKKIISSSNKKKIIYEWRKQAADKVWKRLIQKGYAEYDEKSDIYYLI